MNNNKIDALHLATKYKREQTFIKVRAVLKVMQAKNLPINFQSVAKLGNVSKTWLYKEELIAAEIKRHRNKKGRLEQTLDYHSLLIKKDDELAELKLKNKLLQDRVKELAEQLEVVHGELYRIKHLNKLSVIK